ncbi:MAG: DUF1905 domain-containing protein [Candidatus Moraniibacteriota bacterium]
MAKLLRWTIVGEVWLYPGESAAWHFMTVPKRDADEIKSRFGQQTRGWGSLPVTATIGKTVFQTSIFFPDKRSGGYLLPLKAAVRAREGIHARQRVTVTIVITPQRKKKTV